METWYLPITILPGIGMLILSTTNLIISLNEEMESLLEEAETYQWLIRKKIKQMKLLTYSLAGFYISTALMVLSGLVNFSLRLEISFLGDLGSFILKVGVAFIFISLIILIVYSVKSFKIRLLHFDDCLIRQK